MSDRLGLNNNSSHTFCFLLAKLETVKSSSCSNNFCALCVLCIKICCIFQGYPLKFLFRICNSSTSSLLKKHVEFVGPCINSFIISSYEAGYEVKFGI